MDINFVTHKAELILRSGDFYVIDWRRADGSKHYYIRFIVDVSNSMVHIEGDLGTCVSCWYSRNTLSKIASMMGNTHYWLEKFLCSSDKYEWDEGIAREELLSMSEDARAEYDDDEYMSMIDDIMETFGPDGLTLCTSESRDACEGLLGTCFELPPFGRKVSERVGLWAQGFALAIDQLGLGDPAKSE